MNMHKAGATAAYKFHWEKQPREQIKREIQSLPNKPDSGELSNLERVRILNEILEGMGDE